MALIWKFLGRYQASAKLDSDTGKLSKDATLYALASRPRSAQLPGAIEAPLSSGKMVTTISFVSFDSLLSWDSTYNIRVGRARQVTGPYLDRTGKPMTEGGGTLVIDSQGRWAGPGHCAVLQDKNGDMLVYHAYDLEWRGTPTLRIEHLHWDAEGWPTISRQSHH